MDALHTALGARGSTTMARPTTELVARPRRLRRTSGLRALVRETSLTPNDFIEPLFIAEGIDDRLPVPSMPGVAQLSVAEAVKEARAIASVHIPGIIIFGIPEAKDEVGTEAYAADGIVQ